MGLFNKKESFVGVDIGTASLKVCELENEKGRATLSTYGLSTLPNDFIRDESDKAQNDLAHAIEDLMMKSGVTSKKAVAALPGYAVHSFEVERDADKMTDIAEFISSEAERRVDGSISEYVIDWDAIEDVMVSSGGEERMVKRLLVTAAKRELVERYSRVFDMIGIELSSLETESMALIRSLVGTDLSPILILDMGATATDFCLVDGGFPRLSQGIEIGGYMITEAIAQSLNVQIDQAEQFKKDFGLNTAEDSTDVPETVRGIMDQFITEIRKQLAVYHDSRKRSVEKVILTGGSARLKGLGDYLERSLNVKVYAGNPWARVMTPAKIHDSVKRIGPEFAVAIGLSMKNIYS